MKMDKQLALLLDLQMFAGADDDGLIDFGEDGDNADIDNDTTPNDGTTIDDFDEDGDDSNEKPDISKETFAALDEDDYDEPETETEQEQDESETNPKTEPEKKTQTPEENARFAEERRQRQLKEALESTPEYKLAKSLADSYGLTPEQMLQQLQEQQLRKQAEEQKIPVEVLKAQQAQAQETQRLQKELYRMQFENWHNRVNQEAAQIKEQYKMLSDDDIKAARSYILEVLQNPEVPLEQAVFALHGKKIADGLQRLAKQESLAEVSGRKKNKIVPPSGTKPSAEPTLTAEEMHVAEQMGLTPEEYLKYKL